MICADENYLIQLKERINDEDVRVLVVINSEFSKEEIRNVLRSGRFQFRDEKEIETVLKEGKFIDKPINYTFEHSGEIVCNPVTFSGSHWISHPVSASGLTITVKPDATFDVVQVV